MAYIAQDPNTSSQVNTTDVLSNQNTEPAQPQSTPQQVPSQPATSGASPSSYVSDGNPYGKYSSQTSRKTTSAPSSGSFTNVQTYVDKNKQSSEQLGQGVSKTLTTTSDIARKNLQGVQNQFQQGVQAGSLDDYGNALNQAQTAYNEAATGTAGTKNWNANQASMYAPTKNEQGGYSAEDQALISANKAKVTYGDGSSKEFDTQADAQKAIDSYNASNPGYYTYGDQSPLSVSNERLSDILNASYQGPNELSEIAGYNQSYNQFQDLAGLQNQALSSGPKTELLNRTFATPNTEYNTGNKLLDELLLGQGNANKILTDTAKGLGQSATGKVADEFSDVTKGARTTAQTQTKEMENIKNSARQALNETAVGRNKEVNDRINSVIQDWEKYPQYFKDRFKGELDQHNSNIKAKETYATILPKYEEALFNIPYLEMIPETQASMMQMPEFAGSDPAEMQRIAKEASDKLLYYKNLVNELKPQIDATSQYKDYDATTLNANLSQLEAEALGIRGGEGLYNLLNTQGVEGLFKTATADKNKLVSQDEQSQLARLQSIAELAKGYGTTGSGIDYRNQFTDRDLAGQQNATSALDMDNFRNLLQGAEKSFRTDAAGSTISGSGYGQGSSSGLFGKKKAQAWKTLDQNFGDLLSQNNAYRNMYSDEGVNTDLIRQIANQAQGQSSFDLGNVDAGAVGSITDALGGPSDALSNMLGTGKTTTNMAMLTNPITAPLALANILGSAFGGSSAAAQGEADRNALADAVSKLQQNITGKVNTTGLKNQFSVGKNTAQDLELYKLLGMLDTTNL